MPSGDIGILQFAVSLIALSAILGAIFARPISLWIGEKFTFFLTGFSGQKYNKPQPLIGNAASKAIRGDVAGAMEDYQRMSQQHPLNAELYLRMMELAYGPLQQHELGDEILQRSLNTIRNEKELASLQRLAQALKDGHLITHKHLGWLNQMDQGIQPPLLHLGEAAIVSKAKKF